jgi:DNA topoisomerase IA
VVKNIKKQPYPPFTTSTLQQSANNVLGFSFKENNGYCSDFVSGWIHYIHENGFFQLTSKDN